MARFIFFCMAILALSFIAVPVFTGISKEHDALTVSNLEPQESDSLSFKEIYKIADSTQNFDPSRLNNITPAAGGNISDEFSSGFSGQEDPALKNNAPVLDEEISQESSN